MKFLTVFTLLISLCSCKFVDPKFSGVSNLKVEEFTMKELKLLVDAKIGNENGYGLKVKKADLDILVDGVSFGKVILNKKVKIKRKSDEIYTIPLTLKLESGILMKLMSLLSRDKLSLNLKGSVRGGTIIGSISREIDENIEVDPKKVKELLQGSGILGM